MNVLGIIQLASSEMGIARPTTVFSSSDRTMVEVKDTANEMAEEISNAHAWSRLKRLQTYTGNGETDAYPLPPGYGHMPKDQRIYSSRIPGCALEHVVSSDDWLARTTQGFTSAVPTWHIIGGTVVFNPVLTSGETASLYFVTRQWAEDEDANGLDAFVADTDAFRLPDRLLKLGIILHWRRKKGLPYDAGPFAQAMLEEIARDGGSRVIVVGGRGRMFGDTPLYPFTIGG
jgi:hypothetical protein